MAAPNLLGIPGLREVDLVWFSTAGAPEKRRLAIEESFIIGRGEACQVRLKSEFVSRQHAVVTLNHHSMQVRDLSSNGTMAGTTMLRGQALDVPYRTPIVVGEYTIIVKPTLPDDPSAAEAPPSAAPSSAPSSVDRDRKSVV